MAPRVTSEQLVAFRKARDAAAAQRRKDLFEKQLASEDGREFLALCIYEFGALKVLGFAGDPALRDFQQGQRAVGGALEREAFQCNRDNWALMETERTRRLASVRPEPELDPDE